MLVIRQAIPVEGRRHFGGVLEMFEQKLFEDFVRIDGVQAMHNLFPCVKEGLEVSVTRKVQRLERPDVVLKVLLAAEGVLLQDHPVDDSASKPTSLSRRPLLLIGDDGADPAFQDVIEGCSQAGIHRCELGSDYELTDVDAHILSHHHPGERLLSEPRSVDDLVAQVLLPLSKLRRLWQWHQLEDSPFLHDNLDGFLGSECSRGIFRIGSISGWWASGVPGTQSRGRVDLRCSHVFVLLLLLHVAEVMHHPPQLSELVRELADDALVIELADDALVIILRLILLMEAWHVWNRSKFTHLVIDILALSRLNLCWRREHEKVRHDHLHASVSIGPLGSCTPRGRAEID